MSKLTIRRIAINRPQASCPVCGAACARHSTSRRELREVGVRRPALLVVTFSKHYCETCRKHFSIPMPHLARPSARYTNRVRNLAVDLLVRRGLGPSEASLRLWRERKVMVPSNTLHDWLVEALTREVA